MEILRQIHEAAQRIVQRFEPVKSVGDFTDTPAGMEKLDSICMLLIAVGESLKNLDKVAGDLFMSLIQPCELCGGNPFDYLAALGKHAAEVKCDSGQWVPRN